MEKTITTGYLAFSNLRRKPFRTGALIFVIALTSAVLLGCFILTASLKGGIYGIQSQIGADLMIVPEGYESKVEAVLLYGTPNYFYMDNDIEEIVRSVSGVEKVSSQVYLASVSESCCDFPIQIIGFNPESDFIVKNWAKKRIDEKKLEATSATGEEIVFAGANVNIEKNTVRFYGQTHKIISRLTKSGSGMDNVIYTDINTLQKIVKDARSKGFGFIAGDDVEKKSSVIFVKLNENAKSDALTLRIQSAIDQATGGNQKFQIIRGENLVSSLMKKLSSILVFLYAISVLVSVISFTTLAVVFSLSLNERFKEFSILRVLGADHSKLRNLVFTEAIVLGSSGAVTGIFISLLILIPFNVLISDKLGLPFAMSSAGNIAIFILAVFVITIVSCTLAAVFSAVRISKFEVYGEVK